MLWLQCIDDINKSNLCAQTAQNTKKITKVEADKLRHCWLANLLKSSLLVASKSAVSYSAKKKINLTFESSDWCPDPSGKYTLIYECNRNCPQTLKSGHVPCMSRVKRMLFIATFVAFQCINSNSHRMGYADTLSHVTVYAFYKAADRFPAPCIRFDAAMTYGMVWFRSREQKRTCSHTRTCHKVNPLKANDRITHRHSVYVFLSLFVLCKMDMDETGAGSGMRVLLVPRSRVSLSLFFSHPFRCPFFPLDSYFFTSQRA